MPYLEQVRHRLLAVDVSLHDIVLIHAAAAQGSEPEGSACASLVSSAGTRDAHCTEHVKHALVAGVDAIKDKRHYDSLPSWSPFLGAAPPELGLALDDVADVEHDAMQCASDENLVFIVVGDGDLWRMAVSATDGLFRSSSLET